MRAAQAIPPLLLLLSGISLPASADEDLRALIKELRDQVSELKAQVKESNARIGELEQKLQQEQVAATTEVKQEARQESRTEARPVTEGDVKGSIKLPGSATSIAFGGYAKLDALFSSVSAGTDRIGDQRLSIPQIPVGAARTGEHNQINLHAKESRFWFRSFTPSKWGDINTLIELDLYGSADSYIPRLRHAYGSIGNFLAGQTWTTFTNSDAIPETLEPGTPVGDSVVRQPMARWTQPFANSYLNLQLALEVPTSKITSAKNIDPAAIVSAGDDRYPDMIIRLNSTKDWGTLSLAAMGRQIRFANTSGNNQESWGGAVSLAGKINTSGLDNMRFVVNYGAVARYITDAAYPDASLDANGHLELNTVTGVMVAYQHYWNELLRSTVALGYSHADLPDFVSTSLTREARSAHINLMWNPVPQVLLGLEYLYALRELQDGQEGDLNRIQFGTRFFF